MNGGPDFLNAQAARVADYLELHPDSTAKQIDAACDTGCITKVLSIMPSMGYGLRKRWQSVTDASDNRTRQVRMYRLTHRPPALRTPSPTRRAVGRLLNDVLLWIKNRSTVGVK